MLLETILLGIGIAIVLSGGGTKKEDGTLTVIESKDLQLIENSYRNEFEPQGWVRKDNVKVVWLDEDNDWTFRLILSKVS